MGYLIISILCLSVVVYMLTLSIGEHRISLKEKAVILFVLLVSTVSLQNFLVKVLDLHLEYFSWIVFLVLIASIVAFEMIFLKKKNDIHE